MARATPPPNLAKFTEAQLAQRAQEAHAQKQAAVDVLAAIEAERKTRADAVRAKEERRLGKLAYAAGFAGIPAGDLEKAFTWLAEQFQAAEEGAAAPEEGEDFESVAE